MGGWGLGQVGEFEFGLLGMQSMFCDDGDDGG